MASQGQRVGVLGNNQNPCGKRAGKPASIEGEVTFSGMAIVLGSNGKR
jgi:hypothetical protein